jgi:hypothetical protein
MSVTFAGRILRRLGIAGRGRFPSWKARNAITSGLASIAGTQPRNAGQARLNIKARALMLHNRNGKAASAYERIHTILSEGRK